MMEARECSRFEIPREEKPSIEWETDIDGNIIRGKVRDIGLGGFGIEIKDPEEYHVKHLVQSEQFFIKIMMEDDFFIAGVRLAWSVWGEDQRSLFIGGLKLTIISPEDNLRLAGYIDRYRNGAG